MGDVGGGQTRGGVLGHQLAQERRDTSVAAHVLVLAVISGAGQSPAPAVGVSLLVERQQRAQVCAGTRVDEIDAGEIRARDAHGGFEQRAIGGGHLVADALDGDGAVAESLLTRDLHPEGAPERVAGWAGPDKTRSGETALERSLLGLAVETALVLLLDPGLGGNVEQLEGELGLTLKHGHQSPFQLAPEGLLFTVLLRALRQRRVLGDAQTLESLTGLGGKHGRAVVAEHAPRQAALLKRLTEPVHQGLRRFLQVPLQVAAQPRVVIEDPERDGLLPLPARQGDAALRLVKVEVPERVHVADLEGPPLAGDEARLQLVASRLAPLAQAVMLHVATHARVAGQRPELRLLPRQDDQVVVDELEAPPRVVLAQLA